MPLHKHFHAFSPYFIILCDAKNLTKCAYDKICINYLTTQEKIFDGGARLHYGLVLSCKWALDLYDSR